MKNYKRLNDNDKLSAAELAKRDKKSTKGLIVNLKNMERVAVNRIGLDGKEVFSHWKFI